MLAGNDLSSRPISGKKFPGIQAEGFFFPPLDILLYGAVEYGFQAIEVTVF